MIYILLILITVGVLLMSPEGKSILQIVGGLGVLCFWLILAGIVIFILFEVTDSHGNPIWTDALQVIGFFLLLILGCAIYTCIRPAYIFLFKNKDHKTFKIIWKDIWIK